MYVMALERGATSDKAQTWLILTYARKPKGQVGGVKKITEDGVTTEWRIADIFRG